MNSYIVRTFLSSVLIICIPRLSALALILPSFTLSVISTPLSFLLLGFEEGRIDKLGFDVSSSRRGYACHELRTARFEMNPLSGLPALLFPF